MPELFWYKRSPQDWLSDPCLTRCSPEARGIWADMLENMYLSKSYFLSGNSDEIARLCRVKPEEAEKAIKELKIKGVAEFEYANGIHKIISRRLLREHNKKMLKKKAACTRWCKEDAESEKCMDFFDAQSNSNSIEGTGVRGMGVQREGMKKPTLEEVKNFAILENSPASDGEAFFYQKESNGWTNNGKPIKNWKATFKNWKLHGFLLSQKQANAQSSQTHKPNYPKRADRNAGTANERNPTRYTDDLPEKLQAARLRDAERSKSGSSETSGQ